MPQEEDIRGKNLKVLSDIEGQVAVVTHEGVLFQEDGILLLELGVDLSHWHDECNKGNMRDFKYVTMDHDSEPILLFLKRSNGNFEITSPWMQLDSSVEIRYEDLVGTVDAFLHELRDSLLGRFGVDLHDYI